MCEASAILPKRLKAAISSTLNQDFFYGGTFSGRIPREKYPACSEKIKPSH
jgi:hypothetical protein